MASSTLKRNSQFTSQGNAEGTLTGSVKDKLTVGNRADLVSKVYGLDYDAILQDRVLKAKTVAKAGIFDKADFLRIASSLPELDANPEHAQALFEATLRHQAAIEGTEDKPGPGTFDLDGEEWEIDGDETDRDVVVGHSKTNAKRYILLGQSGGAFIVVITKVLEDKSLLESVKIRVRDFEQSLSEEGQ